VIECVHQGITFPHIGAVLAEIEATRYWPHRVLTAVLMKADVVLVVSGTPVWARLAKETGRPILLQMASFAAREREQTIRTSTGVSGLWKRGMTKVVSAMEPGALRLAAKVFVENRSAEHRTAEIVGPSRVVRAPVGVDVSVFCPAADYSEDGHLLVVGRMNDPRKNAVFLFRSYAALRAVLPSAPPLVIVGEPPSVELARVVEAAGLSKSVHFVHNATRAELVTLFQKASLLLIPSVEEGFGIVTVEAMACGIPVISTRCTGPEEVIVEDVTGHLTPLDADSFTAKIKEALREPAKRRLMGRNGRSLAVDRYSSFAASRPYLDVLQQL